jgi:hypothetical protein
MDPRHKLTKSLDQLFVDKENPTIMSARTDDEAARNAASSGVTPDAIKQKLEQNLGATHVEIEDMSGMLAIRQEYMRLFDYFLAHRLAVREHSEITSTG